MLLAVLLVDVISSVFVYKQLNVVNEVLLVLFKALRAGMMNINGCVTTCLLC